MPSIRQLTLIHVALAAFLAEWPAWGGVPDAAQFNILKPATTGVAGTEVSVMALDPQGNIWIASRWPFWSQVGLAMLSPEEQVHTPLPGGGFDTGKWTVWSNVHHPIPSAIINCMEFSPDGVMWIGSFGGLTRFDRTASTSQQMWRTWNTGNAPLIHDPIRSIAIHPNGDIWVVNRDPAYITGGVFQFKPATETWIHHPMQGGNWTFAPTSIAIGTDGAVYVTHELTDGFSQYNGSTWTYQPGGSRFWSVMPDAQGNIWFAGAAGVYKWNGSSYQSWPLDVTNLSCGLDGTVYVATWDGPIHKIVNGDTPTFVLNSGGLPWSVIERPNGDLFVNNFGGTMGLGRVRQFNRFGQLLRMVNTFNSGLPDYFIDRIQRDRSGNVWFACGEGGLSRMEGSDGSRPTRWRNWGDHNDQSEPYPWAGNEPMDAMYHDDDRHIWMGGNGVGRWNPNTGTFTNFWNWSNSSLGAVSHTGFARDANGDMWVSTDMYGVYRLNTQTNNWEQKLFGTIGSTSNYIEGMVRDVDGNLWVASFTMLHFFDGTTWFAVGSWHGSPVVGPRAIVADPSGGVWIGASNGLIRYKDAVWTLYNSSNSPLPVNEIMSLDIRPDGLLAMTAIDYDATVPFPGGVCLFDRQQSWRVFSYGTHPFQHHQLGQLSFDGDGDVWVSTMSEGVAEIVLTPTARPGDINGDGVVNVSDLLAVINSWGVCPPSPAACPADVAPAPSGDGVVNVSDLLFVINNWGS